jgi:Ca-activated chloride channel family protein
VTGLKPEIFQVFEDKVEQKIESVSVEDVPLSVGIILDASGSMRYGLSTAKNAAVTFLKMGNVSDEYFLVEFNDSAKVTQDFTTDIQKLQDHLVFLPAKGKTSLFDGIYLGFDKLREGVNPRKFLLVLTDGEENHSRYNFFQLRDFAREHDVQIYGIGGRGRAENRLVVRGGTFGDLVDLTGGRVFEGVSSFQLADVCAKIAMEVKNQYIIAYRSTNGSQDGKYRKIRVKVNQPAGMASLSVRAKDGYYGPAK